MTSESRQGGGSHQGACSHSPFNEMHYSVSPDLHQHGVHREMYRHKHTHEKKMYSNELEAQGIIFSKTVNHSKESRKRRNNKE